MIGLILHATMINPLSRPHTAPATTPTVTASPLETPWSRRSAMANDGMISAAGTDRSRIPPLIATTDWPTASTPVTAMVKATDNTVPCDRKSPRCRAEAPMRTSHVTARAAGTPAPARRTRSPPGALPASTT